MPSDYTHTVKDRLEESSETAGERLTLFKKMAVVLFLFVFLFFARAEQSSDLTFTLHENISSFKGNDP